MPKDAIIILKYKIYIIQNLKMKKPLFILISLLSFSFIWVGNNKTNSVNKTPKKMVSQYEDTIKVYKDTVKVYKDTIIDENDAFSISNLKKYLKQINAPHPHVIYAIGKQESGYCSYLFKSHNNLFGMMRPNVRTNKSIQQGQKWAKFHHWTHSVDDFIMWSHWTTNGKIHNYNEQQFLRHIDNSYANHNGYSSVIKKHFNGFLD